METNRTTDTIFSTSDIADYDYCALAWWYQRYDPITQQDNEELFATLVEIESVHGAQATLLPEYQVIEQVLVQRGAFDTGNEEDSQATTDEEQDTSILLEPRLSPRLYARLRWALIISGLLSVAMLIGSFLLSIN